MPYEVKLVSNNRQRGRFSSPPVARGQGSFRATYGATSSGPVRLYVYEPEGYYWPVPGNGNLDRVMRANSLRPALVVNSARRWRTVSLKLAR